MKRLITELLTIFREKQARDTKPYWGILTEPTCREIEAAICAGNLVPPTNRTPNHGNRDFHIGKIAWFVENWQDGHPVEVSKDDRDIDGGHRVYAARYRGIIELEIVELKTK